MDLVKKASSPSVAKNIKKEKINVAKIVQNLIYATKTMVHKQHENLVVNRKPSTYRWFLFGFQS